MIKVINCRYDKSNKLSKKRRSLWSSAIKVRKELELLGYTQEALDKRKNALDVKGVIYALLHLPSKQLYVGHRKHSGDHKIKVTAVPGQLHTVHYGLCPKQCCSKGVHSADGDIHPHVYPHVAILFFIGELDSIGSVCFASTF